MNVFFVFAFISEYSFIPPLDVVCPGPWNITVRCTTHGSDVQIWTASGLGEIQSLYMFYGVNFTVHLEPCTLTLVFNNTEGKIMNSSMNCPALASLNGTVFTCKTSGGQMDQTTLWFGSCQSSPPPQFTQAGELQIV